MLKVYLGSCDKEIYNPPVHIPDELPRFRGEIATPSRTNYHAVTEGATLPI